MKKTQPNDLKLGCKSPSNLIEFIQTYGDIKKELENFEGVLKRDEVVEL